MVPSEASFIGNWEWCTVRGAKLQLKSNEPIYEGDEVSLHCQLDGNPVGWTYEIYKEASTHSYLHKVQTESTLTFSPVTQSQRGYYRCRAGKGGVYSTYSEYVWLEVSVRGAKLQLKSNEPIYEGDEVSLHCQLDGNPVGWTYEIYKEASTHSYLHKVQTESTLTFSNVTQSQRGHYRCRAEKGGVYSTYSEYVWLEVSVLPNLPNKPILIVLPSVTVWEGDTVTLRCLSKSEVTGTQLTYRFNRDETPVGQETTQNKFRVQSAQLNDTGKYWCEVKEQRKETEKKQSDRVQLTVKAMCVTLSASPSTSVKVIDSINLASTWEGKMSSTLIFNFLRNNETVKSSSDSAVFSINQTDKNHTGSYMCAVESSGRRQTYSNEIEIEVQARKKHLTWQVSTYISLYYIKNSWDKTGLFQSDRTRHFQRDHFMSVCGY
ncbi:Fc receptor-like protein 5 [Polypterus senegalus]|uniref:Fc receptor-like protein 5 n=1 Tax=Polypterus senegalus TaxID=55291 RepID=UPI001962A473|nr:Fc receptor-like protein 5 [Polypterus senegalus]